MDSKIMMNLSLSVIQQELGKQWYYSVYFLLIILIKLFLRADAWWHIFFTSFGNFLTHLLSDNSLIAHKIKSLITNNIIRRKRSEAQIRVVNNDKSYSCVDSSSINSLVSLLRCSLTTHITTARCFNPICVRLQQPA